MFSVGYGPDPSGKVALNFGPVNREGGWRRLNVAVSRARKEMIVFSTLRPEQIDLGRTTSQGVAGLKAFLEFAQKGKAALPQKPANISVENSMVEKLIAEKIRELGYEVHTNIGCSEYKIDIGIVHPDKKGEYVLGIMCDGRNYRAASTARDRNILQEGVLKSLGWNIYRVPADDSSCRNMEDIANAIKYILKNQVSLSKPDLVREVYKIFGFSRGNSGIEDAVFAGLDTAVSKEYVSVDSSDRVVIK